MFWRLSLSLLQYASIISQHILSIYLGQAKHVAFALIFVCCAVSYLKTLWNCRGWVSLQLYIETRFLQKIKNGEEVQHPNAVTGCRSSTAISWLMAYDRMAGTCDSRAVASCSGKPWAFWRMVVWSFPCWYTMQGLGLKLQNCWKHWCVVVSVGTLLFGGHPELSKGTHIHYLGTVFWWRTQALWSLSLKLLVQHASILMHFLSQSWRYFMISLYFCGYLGFELLTFQFNQKTSQLLNVVF